MQLLAWDGVAVEVINLVAGLVLFLIAIYARNKFEFRIFRLGWSFIAISGIIKVISSSFRIYYSYYELHEYVPYGRALLVIGRVMTVIGVYLLASAAIDLWGDT